MQIHETMKAQSGAEALNSSRAQEIKESPISYSNLGARLLPLSWTQCTQMKLCLSIISGGVEGRAYRAVRSSCKFSR